MNANTSHANMTASSVDTSVQAHMQTLGAQAKQASAGMAKASAATKSKALRALAALLRGPMCKPCKLTTPKTLSVPKPQA